LGFLSFPHTQQWDQPYGNSIINWSKLENLKKLGKLTQTPANLEQSPLFRFAQHLGGAFHIRLVQAF
jgi:hypothetical protein